MESRFVFLFTEDMAEKNGISYFFFFWTGVGNETVTLDAYNAVYVLIFHVVTHFVLCFRWASRRKGLRRTVRSNNLAKGS